jgi:hypothetical protein
MIYILYLVALVAQTLPPHRPTFKGEPALVAAGFCIFFFIYLPDQD